MSPASYFALLIGLLFSSSSSRSHSFLDLWSPYYADRFLLTSLLIISLLSTSLRHTTLTFRQEHTCFTEAVVSLCSLLRRWVLVVLHNLTTRGYHHTIVFKSPFFPSISHPATHIQNKYTHRHTILREARTCGMCYIPSFPCFHCFLSGSICARPHRDVMQRATQLTSKTPPPDTRAHHSFSISIFQLSFYLPASL